MGNGPNEMPHRAPRETGGQAPQLRIGGRRGGYRRRRYRGRMIARRPWPRVCQRPAGSPLLRISDGGLVTLPRRGPSVSTWSSRPLCIRGGPDDDGSRLAQAAKDRPLKTGRERIPRFDPSQNVLERRTRRPLPFDSLPVFESGHPHGRREQGAVRPLT